MGVIYRHSVDSHAPIPGSARYVAVVNGLGEFAPVGEDSPWLPLWQRRAESLLAEGEPDALIAELMACLSLPPRRKANAEALDGLIRYYRTNAHRMRYAAFRQAGFPIGRPRRCMVAVLTRRRPAGSRSFALDTGGGYDSRLRVFAKFARRYSRCACASQKFHRPWAIRQARCTLRRMKTRVMPLLMSGLLGCATAPEPARPRYTAEHQPTFGGLRGEPLTVVVVDRAALFSDSPEVLELARQSVEQELQRHAVTISADNERQLVLEVNHLENKTGEQAMLQCVRVVARLEKRSQKFLPGSQYSSSVCEGSRAGAPTDPLTAALFAPFIVGSSFAKLPQASKDRASALSRGLSEVLSQLDAHARYGSAAP